MLLRAVFLFGKVRKCAQNIHKLALFYLFSPLFSQKICLIHQFPALMLDLISGPCYTLASDPHDLECSCMLQAPSRKGSCAIPQCNTLYTHLHLFTLCSTCMPDYCLLSFINYEDITCKVKLPFPHSWS